MTGTWRKATAWKIRHRCGSAISSRERFTAYRGALWALKTMGRALRKRGLPNYHSKCRLKAVRP